MSIGEGNPAFVDTAMQRLQRHERKRKLNRGVVPEEDTAHRRQAAVVSPGPQMGSVGEPMSNSVIIKKRDSRWFTVGDITVSILKGDITQRPVDAIVNAANGNLRHGDGVARAIVATGGRSIQTESDEVIKKLGRPLKVTEVARTGSGNLPCEHIFHAVGPVWPQAGSDGEEQECRDKLTFTCLNTLNAASQLKEPPIMSIAFPAISSGIFGMPKNDSASSMLKGIQRFCQEPRENPTRIELVYIVLFDQRTMDAFFSCVDEMFLSGFNATY